MAGQPCCDRIFFVQQVNILCKIQNPLVPFSFGFVSILVVFPTLAAIKAEAKIDAFNPGLSYWINKSLVYVDHVSMQRHN